MIDFIIEISTCGSVTAYLPWAFREHGVANSMRFTYRKPNGGLRMFQGGEV